MIALKFVRVYFTFTTICIVTMANMLPMVTFHGCSKLKHESEKTRTVKCSCKILAILLLYIVQSTVNVHPYIPRAKDIQLSQPSHRVACNFDENSPLSR
jgi:hypothetical protein